MSDNRGTKYCPRCNERHRNWDKCPRDTGPDDLRPAPPGYKLRTHRMNTMEVRAENSLQFPHKARRVGRLTEPPGAGKDAA
jgi:hypothetical protein